MTSSLEPYYLRLSENHLLDIAVKLLLEKKDIDDVKNSIQNTHVVHYRSKLTDEQLDEIVEIANFIRL